MADLEEISRKLNELNNKLNEKEKITDYYIKEIDKHMSNIFLRNNHLQGECDADICIGLFDLNDELLQLLCISKILDNQYEINRLCNLLDNNLEYYLIIDYFYKLSHKAEHTDDSFICWVKDYEWNDPRKREVLKSYWLYAAGKVKNKFYARDCEVKEVPTKEARAFELEHCFYGKRGASLNLGLYTKKEKYGIPAGTLIMLYTFGKNFFGKDNSIEVLRVGTMKFCTVTGGASKLLNYFLANYPTLKIGQNDVPVEKLKFYSDYDHNIGGSMEQLGFDFVNYSKGGFMNLWLETGEVKHREPARHKLIMEKMKEGLILAVPNSGVKTFELIP